MCKGSRDPSPALYNQATERNAERNDKKFPSPLCAWDFRKRFYLWTHLSNK